MLNKKKYIPLYSLNRGNKSGEVVEWSITAVLKTVELRGSGGSNPSLSARNLENQGTTRFTNKFTNRSKFVRIVLYLPPPASESVEVIIYRLTNIRFDIQIIA